MQAAIDERLWLGMPRHVGTDEPDPRARELLDEQSIFELRQRVHQKLSDRTRSPTPHETL